MALQMLAHRDERLVGPVDSDKAHGVAYRDRCALLSPTFYLTVGIPLQVNRLSQVESLNQGLEGKFRCSLGRTMNFSLAASESCGQKTAKCRLEGQQMGRCVELPGTSSELQDPLSLTGTFRLFPITYSKLKIGCLAANRWVREGQQVIVCPVDTQNASRRTFCQLYNRVTKARY